jgi:hypothetical protein
MRIGIHFALYTAAVIFSTSVGAAEILPNTAELPTGTSGRLRQCRKGRQVQLTPKARLCQGGNTFDSSSTVPILNGLICCENPRRMDALAIHLRWTASTIRPGWLCERAKLSLASPFSLGRNVFVRPRPIPDIADLTGTFRLIQRTDDGRCRCPCAKISSAGGSVGEVPGRSPPCTDQTDNQVGPRELLLPGFQQVGLPSRCWISLQQRLDLLCWRDSHPLE